MSNGDYNPCFFCGIRNCFNCMVKNNSSISNPVRIIEKFDENGKLIERIIEPMEFKI